MNIAQASLEELRYYFILARDFGLPEIQILDFGGGRCSGGECLARTVSTLRCFYAPSS